MPSKQKKKLLSKLPCGYCGEQTGKSEPGHAIGKCFFRDTCTNPKDPILIPECRKCNNIKSFRENYSSIIMPMFLGMPITERIKRGIIDFAAQGLHIHIDTQIVSHIHTMWQTSNIVEIRATSLLNWNLIEDCFQYIAMGIIYNHVHVKSPMLETYTHRVTSLHQLEFDPMIILKFLDMDDYEYIYYDNGRYNGKATYFVALKGTRAIVSLQMFDKYQGNKKPERTTIISLLDNKAL
jgi:hypothetical protein